MQMKRLHTNCQHKCGPASEIWHRFVRLQTYHSNYNPNETGMGSHLNNYVKQRSTTLQLNDVQMSSLLLFYLL